MQIDIVIGEKASRKRIEDFFADALDRTDTLDIVGTKTSIGARTSSLLKNVGDLVSEQMQTARRIQRMRRKIEEDVATGREAARVLLANRLCSSRIGVDADKREISMKGVLQAEAEGRFERYARAASD